ncbi:uncharacterized protein [Diabrotica undecimpunctata]|uniref:uncharacterized protein n=1 Tax=Diabrotica undecimpunctata TaxID=50387 RepID=UPI003B64052F
MTDTCKGLEPFSFQGNNISHEWKFWKQKFQLFLTASGKSEKPDHIKIAILLNQLGDEGLKIFNTFEYENVGDDQKYNVVLCKFDTYCSPLKNLIYEHFKFFKRDQLQNESIDQFVTALKQLASTCEFKEKDTLILDRIVLGTHDLRIQEKLLQCADLKLAQAIDICRAMENSAVTQREISKESESVSVVKKRNEENRPENRPGSTGQSRYGSKYEKEQSTSQKVTDKNTGNHYIQCYKCGLQHIRGKCPAFFRYCSLCNKKGHYRKFCPDNNNKVHEINDNDSSCSNSDTDLTDEQVLVWTVNEINPNSSEWFQKIIINGKESILKVDTGSEVNILNSSDFKNLNIDYKMLENTNSSLSSYTGHVINVVDNDKQKSLLGLKAARDFQIVCDQPSVSMIDNETNHIINSYKSIFSGVGKVNRYFNITLSSDAVPFISGTRKIPLAIRSQVKDKLDDMVRKNLIVPVSEPTEWQNPIVVVPKNKGSDIRICMDPVYLNKYVKRERFPIPTQDTLFAKLSGANYFTLLDASSAFLQLPLNYESSLLCTFTTPFGRYRYLRLPYGLTCAPEIFQKYMSELLDSHQISNIGISPDHDKTEAITKMTPPSNKKELQRFLGTIVYLAKFIPNLSEHTSPLRCLLSSKNEWHWGYNEQACFDKLKNLLASATTLHYFNPDKKTILSVDASPYGLGAMVSQDGFPIEFASVSLTPTQRRNHIEKELLGIVYGCERFSFYLYGIDFEIETDHRPLLGLLKKPLDEMSPRIQRLAMQLMRYKFSLKYVPGKNLKVPDNLSRDQPNRLPELKSGQQILLQEKKRKWNPGVVMAKKGSRDYMVKVNDTAYRRNRHYLRPVRSEAQQHANANCEQAYVKTSHENDIVTTRRTSMGNMKAVLCPDVPDDTRDCKTNNTIKDIDVPSTSNRTSPINDINVPSTSYSTSPGLKTSRSGRVIRPPDRFTY